MSIVRFAARKSLRWGVVLVLLAAFGVLVACSLPTPPATVVSNAPTVLVPFTPNPQDAVLPTLLPTVVLLPTDVSSPTAVAATSTPIVITTVPTVTPIQITPTVPVSTRPPTTAAPVETATLIPEGLLQVVVTALRVEPATPKADVGGTFFVTFQNASGKDQGYNWAVEIWDTENDKRPYGLTTPQDSAMPVGTTNLTSTGWTVKGLGECHAYRARVIARDDEDNRATFVQPNGAILWLDFSVCP